MIHAAILLVVLSAPPESPTPVGEPRVSLRGVWVLDADGKPVPPDDFRRGLQTSGLVYRNGELWSVGDQRSEYPGSLIRIDPRTARRIGKPIPFEIPAKSDGESPEWEDYRNIPKHNPDFEGLALVPADPRRLIAVTEEKTPWIVDVRIEGDAGGPAGIRARIERLTRVVFPDGLAPWRDNPDYRLEGCAVSDDSETVYLAFERARDDLPRIFQLPMKQACLGAPVTPVELPIPFKDLPRRKDKERALLNVNDIQFVRLQGRASLVAVLRDQERLLLIDLERKSLVRTIDLELLDPDGQPIEWVSPEALALDAASDRLWIVNDPDSMQHNYRERSTPEAAGHFADYSPLLFEMKLSTLLGPDGGPQKGAANGSEKRQEKKS